MDPATAHSAIQAVASADTTTLSAAIKVAGALIGAGAGVGGAGAGVGAIGGSMCEATARQPELINTIRVQFFLAAAIIEGFTFLLLALAMIVLFTNGGF
ncbi:MAG TPA: F0F1 ATP synthase subunit C [Phycisphaerae bacterium]|nr:F0F1 ATP synthase subunit C [Phycisphaerae bacterium]